MLHVVHEGVQAHLKQVVFRLVGRRELIVDDSPPARPPIVKDVVEHSCDVDRFAVEADLKRDVHAAAAVAEHQVLHFGHGQAFVHAVGQDFRKLVEVTPQCLEERHLLLAPGAGQPCDVDVVAVHERQQLLRDFRGAFGGAQQLGHVGAAGCLGVEALDGLMEN